MMVLFTRVFVYFSFFSSKNVWFRVLLVFFKWGWRIFLFLFLARSLCPYSLYSWTTDMSECPRNFGHVWQNFGNSYCANKDTTYWKHNCCVEESRFYIVYIIVYWRAQKWLFMFTRCLIQVYWRAHNLTSLS